MKKFIYLIFVSLFLFPLCAWNGGCDSTPSADYKVQEQQEANQQQAMAQTGLPGITNYTELKMMRHLYELRDQSISTYTYVPDMNGKLWHLCDSIGFGLPYAAQFSNPNKVIRDGPNSFGTLPQAEPNGLYMPSSAEGTWIMCGAKGGTQPVYVEPRIIVSTIKLRSVGEYAAD